MSSVRKRIVFDTSSLIPACLNPDREPAQILRRAVLAHDVFVSADTFNELVSVLAVLAREKFNAWRPLDQRMVWVRLFREAVMWVDPLSPITECRDPKDNKFLELTVAAQTDFLVTGDVHLLEMHPFRSIQILQLAHFKSLVFEGHVGSGGLPRKS